MASDMAAQTATKVKGTVKSVNEPDAGFGIVSRIVTDGFGIHSRDNNNSAQDQPTREPVSWAWFPAVTDEDNFVARLSDIKTEGYGLVSVGQLVEFVPAIGDDGKHVALDVTVIGGGAAPPDTAADGGGNNAPDEEKASNN